MKQLSKTESALFHLYPGIIAAAGFFLLTPYLISKGFPPQFGMLAATGGIAVPVLLIHLLIIKIRSRQKMQELNGLKNRLPVGRIILITVIIVVMAAILWVLTQPLNDILNKKLFLWLPEWYSLQDLSDFDPDKVKITLLLNILFSGLIIPVVEEFYFRGYLLPRMESWGKQAFLLNAFLYSIYHFWQPYLYITYFITLLPLSFVSWKFRNLKPAIIAHVILNMAGSVLSFAMFYLK